MPDTGDELNPNSLSREELGERLFVDIAVAVRKAGMKPEAAWRVADLVDAFVEALCDKIEEQDDDKRTT